MPIYVHILVLSIQALKLLLYTCAILIRTYMSIHVHILVLSIQVLKLLLYTCAVHIRTAQVCNGRFRVCFPSSILLTIS